MIDVLRRIEEGDKANLPGVEAAPHDGRRVSVAEWLGEGGLAQLVADRHAGAHLRDLAERYGISESTVKRLLRRWGS